MKNLAEVGTGNRIENPSTEEKNTNVPKRTNLDEVEKEQEESYKPKKLRELQKSFYHNVLDLCETMKQCAKENQSNVSADYGPLLFSSDDLNKKLFPMARDVHTALLEVIISFHDKNQSCITSGQPIVKEENIS